MRLPSKSRIVVILIATSIVCVVFIPNSCTRWVRGLFQPAGLVQWPASSAARATDAVLERAFAEDISPEEARRLQAENQELQRLVVQQQLDIEEWRAAWERATGLRELLPDTDVKLVLAPVISYDADPRRETLRIKLTAASRPLIKEGQWVAAGMYKTPSRELLSRQWLIGRVSEVQTRLARVQLASDPKFRVDVRMAVVGADGTWGLGGEGLVLDGDGNGEMVISQATRDYNAEGFRMVMVPASRSLPFPLSLGEVSSCEQRKDSSQHFDLRVRPWVPVEQLTHVFVISREFTAGE